MDMEGWRFVMDVGIATVVAVLLGGILSFIFNAWVDGKGWKKVKEKIGDTSRGSLNIQHEDIKDAITTRAEGVEKSIVEKTSNIYTKVDNIDKITIKNEALYQNLNQNQKEVRDNVNNLVRDWEKTISENKELKLQLESVKLDNQNTREKLNKLELDNKQVFKENSNLREGNTTIKLELKNLEIDLKDANLKIENLSSENKDLKEENTQIKNENKKLSEHIVLYKQVLKVTDKSKYQEQDLDIELEDDEWENEM